MAKTTLNIRYSLYKCLNFPRVCSGLTQTDFQCEFEHFAKRVNVAPRFQTAFPFMTKHRRHMNTNKVLFSPVPPLIHVANSLRSTCWVEKTPVEVEMKY